MKFSLTKLKAAFGQKSPSEKPQIDNPTETIINDIKDEPLAISSENVMYAGWDELGGYHFMQTIIVGGFHIKTIKGAKLHIVGKSIDLHLDSDMVELESEYSDVPNRSITRIDFQIEKADIKKITRSNIEMLTLTSKKHRIEFKIYKKN